MKLHRPSHATVVAYLALFAALGGSAYAISGVTSKQIANDTIRSEDLKNRKAVKAGDVKPDALTGKAIRETSLDASGIAAVAGGEGAECDLAASGAFETCASTTIEITRRSRVLGIGTGGQYSVDADGGKARCEVHFDGQTGGAGSDPGEVGADFTDPSASNGFALTRISPQPLPPGSHTVELACREVAADAGIARPTIAAIAVGAD